MIIADRLSYDRWTRAEIADELRRMAEGLEKSEHLDLQPIVKAIAAAGSRNYTRDEVTALMLDAYRKGDHDHFNPRPDPAGMVALLLENYDLAQGRVVPDPQK